MDQHFLSTFHQMAPNGIRSIRISSAICSSSHLPAPHPKHVETREHRHGDQGSLRLPWESQRMIGLSQLDDLRNMDMFHGEKKHVRTHEKNVWEIQLKIWPSPLTWKYPVTRAQNHSINSYSHVEWIHLQKHIYHHLPNISLINFMFFIYHQT